MVDAPGAHGNGTADNQPHCRAPGGASIRTRVVRLPWITVSDRSGLLGANVSRLAPPRSVMARLAVPVSASTRVVAAAPIATVSRRVVHAARSSITRPTECEKSPPR